MAMKLSVTEILLLKPSSDKTAAWAFSKVCVLSAAIFACVMSVSGLMTACLPAVARKV